MGKSGRQKEHLHDTKNVTRETCQVYCQLILKAAVDSAW